MDTFFFFQQIALCSADSGKNQRKEETFSVIKSKAFTTILGLWLEYSQADNSQFRNLKTIHFYIADVLILAALVHDLCFLIWAWRAAPVQVPPHTVSLCELGTSLSSTSSTHFLPGSGGRGCARSRSASWEDEGEVFTWSCSPVSSSLTSHKFTGPVGWNSISTNNRIIQYKS